MDRTSPALARHTFLRRPGHRDYLLALPGHGEAARHRARIDRGRSSALVRKGPFRRSGAASGRLPGRDQNRCAVSRRRGLRLAPLPQGATIHEFHRPGARGELDRAHPAPRLHHPGRKRSPAGPTLRSGLGLPAQSERRRRHQRAPSRCATRNHGPRRSVCPSGSDNWPPTRTCARSWLPPSPASSPGSSGPRWWPRPEHHDLPVAQRAIGAASERALHDAPEHRRSRSDPRRRCAHHRSSRRCHGRSDSEATTCEWLYCDFDTRTSSWRFSDPLRSGASSMARSATTAIHAGDE